MERQGIIKQNTQICSTEYGVIRIIIQGGTGSYRTINSLPEAETIINSAVDCSIGAVTSTNSRSDWQHDSREWPVSMSNIRSELGVILTGRCKMPRRLTFQHKYDGWQGVVVVEDGMKLVVSGEVELPTGALPPAGARPWAKGAETAVLVL